jgi:GTP-binding protein Era
MIDHKTGYVAILGLPNSGKSTLLNTLLGQKLSIVTSKPQTTRRRILGILNGEDFQIIFLDTPGIISPSYLLQEKMMDDIILSIEDSDVVIFLIDVKEDPNGDRLFKQEFVKQATSEFKKSKILILNKVDLITQEETKDFIKGFENKKLFDEVIPVSATLSFNTQRVVEYLIKYIPEGPKLFPEDQLTDANERFFVSEIIREKILELYRDEVPYSCEVLIAEFKERREKKDFVNAEIVVEKDSQKAIIIGKGGTSIKKLGKSARVAIEEFLQREVFLELRVKVRKKWRSDENMLRSFGYDKKNR